MSSAPRELVGEFIDAVVRDPARADVMLAANAELLNARWIHEETVVKENPLHAAVSHGSVELVDLLLKAGANGKYRTSLGETVFDAVCENPAGDQPALLDVLARHGLRKPAVDPEGEPR